MKNKKFNSDVIANKIFENSNEKNWFLCRKDKKLIVIEINKMDKDKECYCRTYELMEDGQLLIGGETLKISEEYGFFVFDTESFLNSFDVKYFIEFQSCISPEFSNLNEYIVEYSMYDYTDKEVSNRYLMIDKDEYEDINFCAVIRCLLKNVKLFKPNYHDLSKNLKTMIKWAMENDSCSACLEVEDLIYLGIKPSDINELEKEAKENNMKLCFEWKVNGNNNQYEENDCVEVLAGVYKALEFAKY